MDCFVYDWNYKTVPGTLRAFYDPKDFHFRKFGYRYYETVQAKGEKTILCKEGRAYEGYLRRSNRDEGKEAFYVFPGIGYYVGYGLIPAQSSSGGHAHSKTIAFVVFDYQEICYFTAQKKDILEYLEKQNMTAGKDFSIKEVVKKFMRPGLGGNAKTPNCHRVLELSSYHRSALITAGARFDGYEYDLDPVTLFLNRMNLPASGWIRISKSSLAEENLLTESREFILGSGTLERSESEHHLPEYYTSYKNIETIHLMQEINPLVLSMDIETFTPNKGEFPKAIREEDEIRMIGTTLRWHKDLSSTLRIAFCVFKHKIEHRTIDAHEASPDQVSTESLLKSIAPSGRLVFKSGQLLLALENEEELLQTYFRFLKAVKPNVIIGWNHNGYDYGYIASRYLDKPHLHCNFSMFKEPPKWEYCQWESSAFGRNELTLIHSPGTLDLDLMLYMQKYDSYKQLTLKYVSELELGAEGKIDLGYHEMFDLLGSNCLDSLVRVAEYCIRDTEAPMDIFEKKQVWITVTEMAKVLRTLPAVLCSRGASAKILPPLHYEMYTSGFIMNKDKCVWNTYTKYKGAYVFEPETGVHDHVASLDFNSLYPSIMIHDNICYTTLTDPSTDTDSQNQRSIEVEFEYVPKALKKYIVHRDEAARVYILKFNWKMNTEGVVPNLLKSLLKARKDCKGKLLTCDPSEKVLWDRRQFSYKIAANSIYGVLGSRHPYLNFTPGAACVTSRGQTHLREAKSIIESRQGTVLYGDTDSLFVRFDDCLDFRSYEEKTEALCTEISKVNDDVIKLAFENYFPKILFLSKKRYAALAWNPSRQSTRFYAKGLSVVKKTKSKFAVDLYSLCLNKALEGSLSNDLIKNCLFDLLAGSVPADQLASRIKWNPIKATSQTKVLWEHCFEIGKKVLSGEYIHCVPIQGPFKKSDGQGVRLRDVEWVKRNGVQVDYARYIQTELLNDIDELFELLGRGPLVSQILDCIDFVLERNLFEVEMDQRLRKYFEDLGKLKEDE